MNAATVPAWLAAEYPFAVKAFLVPRGARMNYVDEGPRDGRAVLMVHGNPTWSYYYRRLVRALAPTRRCVAPDHVGMGLSEKPENYPYTLATRIEDLEALVLALRLERVDLVVHDWGGAIGFGFASRHPEMVGRIVVLNTAAFALDRIPARIALCRVPLFGPLLVRGVNGFAGPATWMAMRRRPLTPDEKRGYLYPYDSWRHRVAISAFVQDIPMGPEHSSWPTLTAIERSLPQFRARPVMIEWGGRDFCFNDLFLTRWREILPNAAMHRIADAGHYVLEDAWDEVGARAAEFLRMP